MEGWVNGWVDRLQADGGVRMHRVWWDYLLSSAGVQPECLAQEKSVQMRYNQSQSPYPDERESSRLLREPYAT